MREQAGPLSSLYRLIFHACAWFWFSSRSEALLELIDYCFRKVTLMNIGRFNAFIDDSAAVDLLKETAEQTLQRQACEVGFRTAVSAFDVLRFLTDHLKRMPLSAQVRLRFLLLIEN